MGGLNGEDSIRCVEFIESCEAVFCHILHAFQTHLQSGGSNGEDSICLCGFFPNHVRQCFVTISSCVGHLCIGSVVEQWFLSFIEV